MRLEESAAAASAAGRTTEEAIELAFELNPAS
jgi:hypothetical protein